MSGPRIVLASGSPRRAQLLAEAGWDVCIRPASIDDGMLDASGHDPRGWTMAMAWLKARSVVENEASELGELLFAADTVCSVDGKVFGQPADREDARAMLNRMRRGTHEVWTGMCLMRVGGERHMGARCEEVQIGDLTNDSIDRYLDSEEWRGKAGAYNLSDRIAAGWPVQCDGEASSVMGLSLELLDELLEEVDG